LLWSIKPSEDGSANGLITRFWNLKNEAVQPSIKFYKPIVSAWQTSHIETNKKMWKPIGGLIKTYFNRQQINTYRVNIVEK
jgi:hypothetical protein